MDNYITHIEIEGLFGEKDIRFSPDPKVNVLAGINGSGKSTVLRCLYNAIYFGGTRPIIKFPIKMPKDHSYPFDFPEMLKGKIFKKIKILFNNEKKQSVAILNTFDYVKKLASSTPYSSDKSDLDNLLSSMIYYGNKSFVKVESKLLKRATTYYRQGDKLNGDSVLEPIDRLLEVINEFINDSEKKIELVDDSEKRIRVLTKNKKLLSLKNLSSGEKQLLITLFRVFLLEKEPSILFLDEPEITLHIKWQRKLIDAIFKINPNLQLFIATHASSIFFNGYQDKLILMEDICFPMKTKDKVG